MYTVIDLLADERKVTAFQFNQYLLNKINSAKIMHVAQFINTIDNMGLQ